MLVARVSMTHLLTRVGILKISVSLSLVPERFGVVEGGLLPSLLVFSYFLCHFMHYWRRQPRESSLSTRTLTSLGAYYDSGVAWAIADLLCKI